MYEDLFFWGQIFHRRRIIATFILIAVMGCGPVQQQKTNKNLRSARVQGSGEGTPGVPADLQPATSSGEIGSGDVLSPEQFAAAEAVAREKEASAAPSTGLGVGPAETAPNVAAAVTASSSVAAPVPAPFIDAHQAYQKKNAIFTGGCHQETSGEFATVGVIYRSMGAQLSFHHAVCRDIRPTSTYKRYWYTFIYYMPPLQYYGPNSQTGTTPGVNFTKQAVDACAGVQKRFASTYFPGTAEYNQALATASKYNWRLPTKDEVLDVVGVGANAFLWPNDQTHSRANLAYTDNGAVKFSMSLLDGSHPGQVSEATFGPNPACAGIGSTSTACGGGPGSVVNTGTTTRNANYFVLCVSEGPQ